MGRLVCFFVTAALVLVGALKLPIEDMDYLLSDCPSDFYCPGLEDLPPLVPDLGLSNRTGWIAKAHQLFRDGNYRAAATIYADLLEFDNGNTTLIGFLEGCWNKLYPRGVADEVPKKPIDAIVDEHMRRASSSDGVLVDNGARRLYAEALDSQKRIFLVRGFLTPREIKLMSSHTGQRATAAVETEPVVCFREGPYRGTRAFYDHALPEAAMCLDHRLNGSRKVARRLRNVTSISLSGLPIGISQRPGHGGGALASVSTRPETVAAIDATVESVARRVETLTGIPDDHGMIHQLLAYGEGSSYLAHTDCTDEPPAAPPLRYRTMRKDERAFTTIVLLSDEFDGGETTFPRLDLKLKVAAGDLIFWKNLKRAKGQFSASNPAYRCDPDTTHASNPVTMKPSLSAGGDKADAASNHSSAHSNSAPAAAAASQRYRNSGGWHGKLAWQRWFSLMKMPFAAERRPWMTNALHRRAFQPILNCDLVSDGSDLPVHRKLMSSDNHMVSCRLYGHMPFPVEEFDPIKRGPPSQSSNGQSTDRASFISEEVRRQLFDDL